jgi:hypothetical protein
MAKSLKDILAGVKSSKVVTGSTGTDPGVDYDPKAPAEQDLVAKHKTEIHADRVGNGPEVYSGGSRKPASKDPKNKRLVPNTRPTYEAVEIEEDSSCAECGKTPCGCGDKKKGLRKLLLGGKKESPIKEEKEKKEDKKKSEHEAHQKAHDIVVKTAGHIAKKLYAMNNEEVEQVDEEKKKKTVSFEKVMNKAIEKRKKNPQKHENIAPVTDRSKTIRYTGDKERLGLHKEEAEEINEIGDTEKGKQAITKVAMRAMTRKEKAHKHREKAEREKGAAQKAYTDAAKSKTTSPSVKGKLFKKQEHTQAEYNKAREANTLAKKKSGIVARKLIKLKMAEEAITERHMTATEKKKETAIKKKVDPSEMKSKMQQEYGAEKGKKIYFATIRKKAMAEDLAMPMLEGGKKKKKTCKESGPDTPIRYPSGAVGTDRDTGYAI